MEINKTIRYINTHFQIKLQLLQLAHFKNLSVHEAMTHIISKLNDFIFISTYKSKLRAIAVTHIHLKYNMISLIVQTLLSNCCVQVHFIQ